jgi:Exopolysaccharide synthesis, ExoD
LTKRAVGFLVLLLAISGIRPLPLINVLPAITIVLLAVALLQEDGLLLAVSLAFGILSSGGLRSACLDVGRRDRSPVRKPAPPTIAISPQVLPFQSTFLEKQVF